MASRGVLIVSNGIRVLYNPNRNSSLSSLSNCIRSSIIVATTGQLYPNSPTRGTETKPMAMDRIKFAVPMIHRSSDVAAWVLITFLRSCRYFACIVVEIEIVTNRYRGCRV